MKRTLNVRRAREHVHTRFPAPSFCILERIPAGEALRPPPLLFSLNAHTLLTHTQIIHTSFVILLYVVEPSADCMCSLKPDLFPGTLSPGVYWR